MDPQGMTEDEQLALALKESMKTFTSEQQVHTPDPNPPPYYKAYPGDIDEHDDVATAIRMSLADQGGPGHHPKPNTNSVWGWPSSPISPPPLTNANQYNRALHATFGQTRREVRLVLLGMTGVGKSSTANMIIGWNHFKADCDGSSVTYKCDHAATKIEGRDVLVVDTPGLFDTRQGNDATMREITRCVCLSAPGPHAIILVVQGGSRQTDQVQKCADIIMDVFGDQARRYMIVLFTHRDDLDHHGKTLSAFRDTLPPKMKRVLSACGDRYLAFNNRVTSPGEKKAQVTGLLNMIDNMVAKNGGRCFTNDVYKEFEKKIVDRERKLKEELKRKQDREQREFQARVERETQQRLDRVQEEARKQAEKTEKREHEREQAYQREREQERERERERERNTWKKQREDLERERREQQKREEAREQRRKEEKREDDAKRDKELRAYQEKQERIQREMIARSEEQARQAEADRIRRENQIRSEVRQEVQKDDGHSGGFLSSVAKGVLGVGKSIVSGGWGIIKSIF